MPEFNVGDRVVWLGMNGVGGPQSDYPPVGTLGTVTESDRGRGSLYPLRVHFDDFLTSAERAGGNGALVSYTEVRHV